MALAIVIIVAIHHSVATVVPEVQFTQDSKSAHLLSSIGQDYVKEHLPHVALNKNTRGSLLRRFSPIIYLHPDDQYLPTDPALTFAKYYNATTNTMSIPPAELSGMPLTYEAGHMEDASAERRSTATTIEHHQSLTSLASNNAKTNTSDEYNDFRRPSARSGKARVTAPVTAQARVLTKGKHAGKILLQYWYWHHFNGAQGFSVTSRYGSHRDTEGITRWEWWPLAIHNSDWEHTTVTLKQRPKSHRSIKDLLRGRFKASDFEIESVYYPVHAEVEDKVTEFPREGSHPVVYSHLNSHACYAVPGDYWNKDPGFDGFVNTFVRIVTFGRIQQIKVIDIGFKPEEAIRWADYTILDVSDATEGDAPQWALWRGNWGDSVDQTKMTGPPSYVPSRHALRFTLWLLNVFGKLRKFVKPVKRAPRGPLAHWNWLSMDMVADNYVPKVRTAPPRIAILGFLISLAVVFGSTIVLLSLAAVAFLIIARLVVRRKKPSLGCLRAVTFGRERAARNWSKFSPSMQRTDSDDDLVAVGLLTDDLRSPSMSEAFEFEEPKTPSLL